MGQSRQTETREMPQFQQDFLQNTLLPFATNISGQGFTPYTGQMTADITGTSMRALPQFDRVANIANMTPADYAAMTTANMSPFQSQVINAALAQGRRERDISRVAERAEMTRAGAFGNERRGVYEAERQAAFDIGQQQMIANLMQQGYTQAQAATMAQLGQAQGAAGQAAAGFQQIGGLEQATEQARLDALRGEFMREQELPYQQLAALTSAAGGIPAGYGTTTQSYRPGVLDYLTVAATAASRCWVAREVYGADDIRWLQFREWISNDAPKWLLSLYDTYGERIAGAVRKAPILKRILRPMMDKARKSAGYKV